MTWGRDQRLAALGRVVRTIAGTSALLTRSIVAGAHSGWAAGLELGEHVGGGRRR